MKTQTTYTNNEAELYSILKKLYFLNDSIICQMTLFFVIKARLVLNLDFQVYRVLCVNTV